VPLIINDDAQLAKAVGADGVHLGKDDGDIANARAVLGEAAIIGVSCYNSLDRAVTAQAQGASYVAFGRFFSSNTKPLAAPAQLDTLQQAKAVIKLPIVAIGGILPSNGLALIDAGADLLAVVGGLFDNALENAARQYHALFKNGVKNHDF
jgi:thiamine-phosphate pyrophosphorylase